MDRTKSGVSHAFRLRLLAAAHQNRYEHSKDTSTPTILPKVAEGQCPHHIIYFDVEEANEPVTLEIELPSHSNRNDTLTGIIVGAFKKKYNMVIDPDAIIGSFINTDTCKALAVPELYTTDTTMTRAVRRLLSCEPSANTSLMLLVKTVNPAHFTVIDDYEGEPTKWSIPERVSSHVSS